MARKGLASVILAVALLSGRSSAGPSLVSPTPIAYIESVTHTARGALRAGDRLTVTLRGTGRGSATFHIVGVVRDIGMREIRAAAYGATPALYVGVYSVRPGDLGRNVALFGTLTVGGQEVMAAGARPVTIDTREPLVIARYPRAGETLANVRPNIAAHLLDAVSAVNPGTVRLSVNGQDVTGHAVIAGDIVSYTPAVPFSPGSVRVRLMVGDRAGNTARAEWSFRIAPKDGLIQSVTVNPAGALRPGDLLTVVMTGAPGGRAAFTIRGIPGTIAMRESRTPGVYVGTISVTAGLAVLDAPLLVSLERADRRSTATASVGVTMTGMPPAVPTVISAGRTIVLGDEAVTRIVLRGRSRPGFRILGRLFFQTQAAEQHTLGEFLTVPGADGLWQTAIGPLIFPERARVFVSVVAIDPADQRSVPAVMEIAR